MELPIASRTLDGLLYNVLKMVIKGSKAALLMCVVFPSYVQAVFVLINPCKQQISGFEAHKYGVRSWSKKLRLSCYKKYVVYHDP